jgi:hypothetical protein
MSEKCGQGEFCGAFKKWLHTYEASVRGFGVVRSITDAMLNRTSFKIGDLEVSGVSYREGKKEATLKYCPFCGERIDWFNKTERDV